MMRRQSFFLYFLLLFSDLAIGDIVIKNAWVRAAPSGSKIMAAYMIIDNQTSETITSSKIIANGFEKTEIHTSYVVDEISKMKKLNNLSIKGSESLVMEPGGLHLMLINPDGVPKRNSNVEILMFFENASTSKVVRIEAEVRDQTS
jgi:hypothetical protein